MLVIFDCDGVLVDSMLLHTDVEVKVYRSLGVNVTPELLRQRFAGVPLSEEFALLERETGISIPKETESLMEREKERVFKKKLRLVPHVESMLDALGDVPYCIASGTRLAMLKAMLAQLGIAQRFGANLFSSEMVAKGKPAPDLFLYAAKQMGVPAASAATCLVIEDGPPGVQAGCAAGMRVFGFDGASHCGQGYADGLRAAGAELVFSDMRELPGLLSRQAAMQCRP